MSNGLTWLRPRALASAQVLRMGAPSANILRGRALAEVGLTGNEEEGDTLAEIAGRGAEAKEKAEGTKAAAAADGAAVTVRGRGLEGAVAACPAATTAAAAAAAAFVLRSSLSLATTVRSSCSVCSCFCCRRACSEARLAYWDCSGASELCSRDCNEPQKAGDDIAAWSGAAEAAPAPAAAIACGEATGDTERVSFLEGVLAPAATGTDARGMDTTVEFARSRWGGAGASTSLTSTMEPVPTMGCSSSRCGGEPAPASSPDGEPPPSMLPPPLPLPLPLMWLRSGEGKVECCRGE